MFNVAASEVIICVIHVSLVRLSCRSLMPIIFPVTDKVKVSADGGKDNSGIMLVACVSGWF